MRWVAVLALFLLPLTGHSFDFNGIEKGPSFVVSLDGTGQGNNWKKEACDAVHAGLNSVQISDTTCLSVRGNFVEPAVVSARKTGRHDYHISLRRVEFPNIQITIDNWKPDSDSDFNYVTYKVDFTNHQKFTQVLYRLSRNLNNYDSQKISINKLLDKVYEADLKSYKGETYESKTHYKKIFVEVGAALGFAAFWYYSDKSNENDWDYTGFFESIKEKAAGNSVRYDDNHRALNIGHAGAGMGYYQIARANGMSQKKAFLASFALSAVWEGVVEYREIFSINDMIHTGLSGPVIGEVFHQMARSLRNRDSFLAKTFAVILDGPSGVNTWLNRNKAVAKTDAAFEDEFQFELGWKELGIEGEVWTLPEGEKVKTFLPQGFYTQLKTGLEIGSGFSVEEFQLLTKIAFMGYTQRSRKKKADGSYSGYEFIVSAASEFDYLDRMGDDGDFLVHARVLGTSVVLNAEHKGVSIEAHYDFYGDFAMLRSYALNTYLEDKDNSIEGFPGVVIKEQYYYGFGTTHRAGVSISQGRFSMGASYETNKIKATASKDRYQESMTKAFKARDRHSVLEVWLQMNITPRLSAKVSWEEVKRSGTLYAYKRSDVERAVKGTLQYRF